MKERVEGGEEGREGEMERGREGEESEREREGGEECIHMHDATYTCMHVCKKSKTTVLEYWLVRPCHEFYET